MKKTCVLRVNPRQLRGNRGFQLTPRPLPCVTFRYLLTAIQNLGGHSPAMPVLPCFQGDLVNMQLRNQTDFWSGVMFFSIGVGLALGATRSSIGHPAPMGERTRVVLG